MTNEKMEMKPTTQGWLVRDKRGKMKRAVFFCHRYTIPMVYDLPDYCEVVKCKVEVLLEEKNP